VLAPDLLAGFLRRIAGPESDFGKCCFGKVVVGLLARAYAPRLLPRVSPVADSLIPAPSAGMVK
jgi:hypothetical protein